MKKFMKAISGKTALIIITTLAIICTILEIVTSIRQGTKIDWAPMAATYAAIACWASALATGKKGKEEDK